jgi:hypothetical protein
VLAIDDYLPCAPLAEWLPQWLAPRSVGLCGPTTPRAAPRWLRRWLAPLAAADGTRELDALVHLGPFDRPLDDAHVGSALAALALGGAVLDLAFARGWIVRPWRRTSVFDTSAQRFEAWGRLGVGRLEQWVSGDGRGLVVTLGTRLVVSRAEP